MKKSKRAKRKTTASDRAATNKARGEVSASKVTVRKEPGKKSKPPRSPSLKDQTAGLVQNAAQFLREVRAELTKVTWPTRKDTIASTSVVLVIVILIGAFLGLVDLGLSRILKIVLS